MSTAGGAIPDLPDSSWMRRAACKDEPGDVLTPAEGEEEESLRLQENRNLFCLGAGLNPCPVLNQCKEWALTTDIRTGVAGGLTWPQREELLKRSRGGRRLR